ncbi:MAG: DUF1588 domain-containing protein, partial [Myxococcota bacterium]
SEVTQTGVDVVVSEGASGDDAADAPVFDSDDLSQFDRGAALYNANCAACHGALESSDKRGRSAESIRDAIGVVPQMAGIALTEVELIDIAFALAQDRDEIREDVAEQVGRDNPFLCMAPDQRSVTPLRRLTKVQYENTLADLLGEQAAASLSVTFEQLPDDHFNREIEQFNPLYGDSHVQALSRAARSAAELVRTNPEARAAVAHPCLIGADGITKEVVEAEASTLIGGQFVIENVHAGASGSYVTTPRTAPSYSDAVNPDYRIEFDFSAPAAGTHAIWLRVHSIDQGADSFWVELDGMGPPTRMNELPVGSFSWVRFADVSLGESGSSHVLTVYQRESGTSLDQILVTPDLAFTPTGIQQSEQAPSEPLSGQACIDSFFERVALSFFRRPLGDEVTTFQELFDLGEDVNESIALVVQFALQSPDFLYLVEEGETATDGTIALTPYEVAARLSYSLLDTTPDAALLDAAADGRLEGDGLDAEIERLLGSPRAREKARRFVDFLFGLDEDPMVGSNIEDYVGGLALTPLVEEMLRERYEYYEHMFFDSRAGYSALMTSTKSFARTTEAAEIYGHAPVQGSVPAAMGNGHKGIVLRAPFLFSTGFETHPILRGAKLRSQFLCDEIPLPTPDNIVLGPDVNTREARETLTTRERTDAKTSADACASCHRDINPAGYAFEGFDSLGRYREVETQYDSDGSFIATHPIDTVDTLPPLSGDEEPIPFDSADDLLESIAASSTGRACYATQILRFYSLRAESADDACVLADMYDSVDGLGGSLVGAVKAMILHPSFSSARPE